jgi:hypothetical protein
VTVEPGKLTEARVKHAASKITLKLVQISGGEALADTQWTILTRTGDVVKEAAGALPFCILATGSYAAVARHGGASYTRTFQVGIGEAKQVEVAMESGPASPEALRAITNPPPPPPAPATPAADSDAGAATSSPPSGDSGLAFDGQSPAARPGLSLPDPTKLLHPRAP